MARRKPGDDDPKKTARGKKDPAARDPGSETSGDTRLVNALESDPGFFKDPLLGVTLGKCKIKKLLGEGKTSVVYEAHYAPLNRTVAVKVLQEHMKKVPAVLRVFQQEGRAVAALDHENILKIYDVGEDQGQYYLVLELLHGRDLLKRIEECGEEGLPVGEALGYVRQAAAGLAAAHRKNLVHRDIKPQNLVVEPDGTLKIVDFGLAADVEGAFAGGRLGTPHYMSPEQCRGEAARTASDVYALGITLFHMLVGHPPYAGLHTTDEIIAEHLKGQKLAPEKLRREIPRGVADLVRRMTRMDPDARPSSKELAEILSKIGDAKGGGDAKGARGRGARRTAREVKGVPGALVAVGGAVVLGIVIFFFTRGSKGEGSGEPTPPGPPPTVPAPVADKPPQERAPTDKTLEQQLRTMRDDARREESTGNYVEAHRIYTQIKLKSQAGSAIYKEADAAAAMLKDKINAERGRKPEREVKVFISAEESEKAGKEFEERQEEWRTMLRSFQVVTVRKDMEKLLAQTREASPERSAIESGLKRLDYIDGLLGIVTSRAGTLSGGREAWSKYDPDASSDQIVLGADESGIKVRDEALNREDLHPWAALPPGAVVKFLDALRIAKSPNECLWLGFYCQILGEATADAYFDLATILDDGPEMAAEVRFLRGK